MQHVRVSWVLPILLNLSEVPVHLDLALLWNPREISPSFSWVTVSTESQIWISDFTASDCNGVDRIVLNSPKKTKQKTGKILKDFFAFLNLEREVGNVMPTPLCHHLVTDDGVPQGPVIKDRSAEVFLFLIFTSFPKHLLIQWDITCYWQQKNYSNVHSKRFYIFNIF